MCSTYFLVSLGWLRKAGLYLSETLGHAHLLCGQLANLPLSNVPGARQTSRPIYLKLRLEVTEIWTFLVAQSLRILLPVQGPRVPFPLRKGSTCQGAMKPMGNNYWTCTLEPMLCNKKSHCSPQLEKARAQQWSLGTAKNKHTHTHTKEVRASPFTNMTLGKPVSCSGPQLPHLEKRGFDKNLTPTYSTFLEC